MKPMNVYNVHIHCRVLGKPDCTGWPLEAVSKPFKSRLNQ